MKIFSGDERALTAARLKINEEFNKNKHVKEEDAIKAMIKLAEDVERELRTQVIQAREIKPGVFEAKVNEDTVMLDNVPFDEHAVIENSPKSRRSCCQSESKSK
ncbi:complex III assembly factor LYRM7 isoform X2 [Amyelois transitella]|nr:complex III assembly factor LYRM7 isoform X2 [Amyelois transitella]